MNNRKRVISLLLTGILALSFAACNSGGTPTPAASGDSAPAASTSDAAPTDTPAGEEVAIKFWTHYSDDIAFTQKKVEDYNTLMAGKVKVELKHVADDYNNILLLALKNGDAPDLFANGIELAQLVEMNYLAPLDDLMSPEMEARLEGKKQNIINHMNDNWYSMPFRGYNFRLAWNKDMFKAAGLDPESPPKTYAEVVEYAKVLSEYGATQSPQQFGFMLPTGEDWIWWIYGQQMVRVSGDNMFDFTQGKFTFAGFKPVMEMYLALKDNGSLFPGGTSMLNDPARAQFSAGNAGMILAASWDIGVFNDQFPAEIEWDVTELPGPDGERHGYSQMDAGSYLQINAASTVKQEAMDFYEYLLSEPVLVEYYEGGFGVPAYDGIAEKATVVPDKPGFVGFSTVEVDRMYPLEPNIMTEGKHYGAMMNDVMNGAITIDEAIAALNKEYNEALDKAIADGQYPREDYIIPTFSPLTPLG